METICSINSVSVSLKSLQAGFTQLKSYIDKYGSRLAPKNVKLIKDISKVIEIIATFLENRIEIKQSDQA